MLPVHLVAHGCYIEGMHRSQLPCKSQLAGISNDARTSDLAIQGPHLGPVYGKFRVAKEQIPMLMGVGGENVKALENTTGARVVLRGEEKTLHFVSPSSEQFAAAEAMMSRLTGQDMKVSSFSCIRRALSGTLDGIPMFLWEF